MCLPSPFRRCLLNPGSWIWLLKLISRPRLSDVRICGGSEGENVSFLTLDSGSPQPSPGLLRRLVFLISLILPRNKNNKI